jgi:hypothetical protein
MTKRLVIVGILLGLFAGRADAQTPAISPALVKTATGQLGASINNAGLQQSFDFSASRKLTRSTHPWLADAQGALGGTLAATPAGVRGGPWAEFAPLSVYVVRAGVEPGQYFGTFHSLTSFDTRLDVFDPDARKARGSARSGRTMKWYVAQTLQLRAGPVVARSTFNTEWWSSTASGPLFYEPTRDTLLEADGDRIASMSSAIVYQKVLSGGGQFMFGPTHSIMRIDGHELNKVQKVGLVAVRQMAGNHLGLRRPSLSAQATYYVDDPSKHGQWGGAVAIGFSLGKR